MAQASVNERRAYLAVTVVRKEPVGTGARALAVSPFARSQSLRLSRSSPQPSPRPSPRPEADVSTGEIE